MLARVVAAKETSPRRVAKTACEKSAKYSVQQQEPAETFNPHGFSWSIGNIALSAPADNGQPNSGNDGRSGKARHWGRLRWPIQAKLEVGAVDDPLEHEADRVADRIMRMPEPTAASAVNVTSLGRRQPVQRCSCGGSSPGELCETCKTKQRELQRKDTGVAPLHTVPAIVEQVLGSPGQPLDTHTRNFMEPRFGADFSGIRIHTDSKAAESARAVNALAYTVGSHIVFQAGQFTSYKGNGGRLLAHELTHVLQQASAQYRLQRTCGEKDIKKLPTSLCPIAVVAGGVPHGHRFKFKTGCDEFAPGEEAKLRKFLMTIPSTSEIEVFGMSSSDGDASFNEALACARTDAALQVIKDEHLDQSVKASGGAGAISGTFGNPEFRAVAIRERKGGPPIPSSDPDLKNVFLVTGDKPNVIYKDEGELLKVTLDKPLVALGTADIAGGGDCSKYTLGFFQICRPFDTERVIYRAKGTDLQDDRSDQVRKQEPILDVFNVGDIWTYSAVANCANPGVLRSTQVFFEDTPSTGFVFAPAGDFIKGLAWHDFFFTVFSVQHPDGTIRHLKSFYWDIHHCESFDPPTGTDKIGKSKMKKSNVNIGSVADGAPAEPGLELAGKPAKSTCNKIIKSTKPNITAGSFDITSSC